MRETAEERVVVVSEMSKVDLEDLDTQSSLHEIIDPEIASQVVQGLISARKALAIINAQADLISKDGLPGDAT